MCFNLILEEDRKRKLWRCAKDKYLYGKHFCTRGGISGGQMLKWAKTKKWWNPIQTIQIIIVLDLSVKHHLYETLEHKMLFIKFKQICICSFQRANSFLNSTSNNCTSPLQYFCSTVRTFCFTRCTVLTKYIMLARLQNNATIMLLANYTFLWLKLIYYLFGGGEKRMNISCNLQKDNSCKLLKCTCWMTWAMSDKCLCLINCFKIMQMLQMKCCMGSSLSYPVYKV